MRIAFVVVTLDGIGGTARAVVNLANQLVTEHEVRIISLQRRVDQTHAVLDQRVTVDYLIDGRDPEHLRVAGCENCDPGQARQLADAPSLLVPPAWEWQFSALTDHALGHALPRLTDDVLVTVIPGLLAAAAQLLPPGVALVHQEHRNSFGRSGAKDALLAFAPRADAVAMLGQPAVTWLREQLGRTCPETLVVPNMVPPGHRPRSRLGGDSDRGLILAAGRLSTEKQFSHLVRAFGEVAHDLPGWRLRIFGNGPQRPELVATALELGLEDRVELPGTTRDMESEWARADVVVCCSVGEGMPLVLQEAMAAGVPVVSYDCPLAVRDMVDDGVNGILVAPDAEHGLASALLQLGRDRELRQRMGAAGLQASERYDAATIVGTWEQVFEDAVRRRRSGVAPAAEASPRRERHTATAGAEVTPAIARRTLLGAALAVARAADADPVVLPRPFPEPVGVVVPMGRRRAFLDALRRHALPPWASVMSPPDDGWTRCRGSAAEVADAVGHGVTPRLVLEPWPDREPDDEMPAEGWSVEVEFWTPDRHGVIRAPRWNPWIDHIAPDRERITVTVDDVEAPTLPEATSPAAGERRFAVDVVYLPRAGHRPGRDRLARELDVPLLRHSLRSVHLFAPWVRTVHVVLPGDRPEWLVDDGRVHWTEAGRAGVIDPDSAAAWLASAPGVAEHLVVMREEVLLGRPVGVARFFDAGGRPRIAGEVASTPSNGDVLGALLLRHQTSPQPLRRSILGEPPERLPELTAGPATLDLSVREVDVARGDVARTLRRTAAARDTEAVALDHGRPPSRPGITRRHLSGFLDAWTPSAAPWERES